MSEYEIFRIVRKLTADEKLDFKIIHQDPDNTITEAYTLIYTAEATLFVKVFYLDGIISGFFVTFKNRSYVVILDRTLRFTESYKLVNYIYENTINNDIRILNLRNQRISRFNTLHLLKICYNISR